MDWDISLIFSKDSHMDVNGEKTVYGNSHMWEYGNHMGYSALGN